MKTYKDIEQKTLEWFEIKWGKIGGTLSKGLFVKGDTLLIDILSQHLEEFEPGDGFENEAMKRGNDLEPFAVEYLEQYTGLKFEQFGWLQSEYNSLLGISPDGLTSDHKGACEIKCLSRKGHTKILLENEIPLEYIFQCCHYFTVNPDLESLWFCAYRPESVKNFVKELTLNSLVDLGLKVKVETEQFGKKGKLIKPKITTEADIRTIKEWRDYAIEKANELKLEIYNNIKSLNF